jgi:hypothetical protein
LKKKNQKTFGPAGFGLGVASAPSKQKFFASFFQKRSACFLNHAKTQSDAASPSNKPP